MAVREREKAGETVEKVEGLTAEGRRTYVVVGEEEGLPRKSFVTIGPRGRILTHCILFAPVISAEIPKRRPSLVLPSPGHLSTSEMLL